MRARYLALWLGLSLSLGGGMVLTALLERRAVDLIEPDRQALQLVLWGGVGLLLVAGVALVSYLRWGSSQGRGILLDPEDPMKRVRSAPFLTLFLVSFVVLFVEVMLIRYCGSQIRIFSFYKNVPLVSAFLGLGLGACLGGGRSRHVLAFLLWLLPLSVFLAGGILALDRGLGVVAARASSEHILGIAPRQTGLGELVASQLLMGLFCVAVLVSITSLFALLGRLLGDAFEPVGRLPGYTVNILGSLAGIFAFVLLSYLQTPPWVWYVTGLVPLLWWLPRRMPLLTGGALILCNVVAVLPDIGETVWSPYQKLVGFSIPMRVEGKVLPGRNDYVVQISDVFYQIATDLSPAAVERVGFNRFPHYDGAYAGIPTPERVLIVGAGTGNDVAAALRAGVEEVDAVDIDPAIVAMGRRHHPEAPYDDPRVRVIVDDARSDFQKSEPGTYDAVVFGLLDSHTQLGMSSVRLDNYVFTVESLTAAARLVKPGGSLIISAATFQPWFQHRFETMLAGVTGNPVDSQRYGPWVTYRSRVTGPPESGVKLAGGLPPEMLRSLPVDDWPFLYLPRRGIPAAYVVVVLMLAVASILVLRVGGLELGRFTPYHGHLFFLGAAFLLMEVYAINRLALLFGTTWLVSAVTIGLILTLIVAANLTVLAAGGKIPYAVAYPALVASLLASYLLSPSLALGGGLALTLAYGFLLLSPVFFAGLVFARSFRFADVAGPAIGANILGSVLGGWVEYSTMLTGIRSMVLLALVFYLASLLGLMAWRRSGRAPLEVQAAVEVEP